MKSEKPSSEGLYARSIRASVFVGLLVALFFVVYAPSGTLAAGAYLVFLGWTLANLALWRLSLREILGRRRIFIVFPLLTAKAFWIAILLLLCHAFSIGKKVDIFCAFGGSRQRYR